MALISPSEYVLDYSFTSDLILLQGLTRKLGFYEREFFFQPCPYMVSESESEVLVTPSSDLSAVPPLE
jgi:hypothetical protein